MKSIANSLLGIIYKPTPSKWPADDFTDDPTNSPADDPTLALLLPPAAPV